MPHSPSLAYHFDNSFTRTPAKISQSVSQSASQPASQSVSQSIAFSDNKKQEAKHKRGTGSKISLSD